MSMSSIGANAYTSAYSNLREALEEKKLYAMASSAEQDNSASGTTAMGKEISEYLDEIPKGDDGRLSFKDVDAYRKMLETKWDASVMVELDELGVDITKEMPLTYDTTTGKVTVSNDHPDKAVVDAYFENNPDKVKEFQKIIQLGKLTATADSQLTQNQQIENIQQQSMAWWFEDNSDPTKWFDGGGMLAGMGISAYTGINITV